ncbi:hypothetical protein TWF225_005218 [Orbilia oligospora]|nr:hypothetical protein TWF751_005743 [Orbilia oligospora]KAF3185434.1 hypothetical protein TWF225_005218 [Orbilia oligospora]KAF3252410.1 hypothetical protein TWF128_006772 [Orbilia oligospora]KAF3258114.1 hypothetical protein TWF217_005813 [Orbilia oligospora]KAF3289152.1 hypothetical protein TWF132_007600 [Orbilia oligospora]
MIPVVCADAVGGLRRLRRTFRETVLEGEFAVIIPRECRAVINFFLLVRPTVEAFGGVATATAAAARSIPPSPPPPPSLPPPPRRASTIGVRNSSVSGANLATRVFADFSE